MSVQRAYVNRDSRGTANGATGGRPRKAARLSRIPATECAPCLPLALARAFDAAGGQADSAITQYELFLATPYYNRLLETDPLGLALAHERLGELYEARGDADLEPRVAQARQRLARLGVHEGKR